MKIQVRILLMGALSRVSKWLTSMFVPADMKTVKEETEITVANADFAAAIGQNVPNPWGKGHLNLYCCCLLVYLVSTMIGVLSLREFSGFMLTS